MLTKTEGESEMRSAGVIFDQRGFVSPLLKNVSYQARRVGASRVIANVMMI